MAQNPKRSSNAKTSQPSLAALLYPAGIAIGKATLDDSQNDPNNDQAQADGGQENNAGNNIGAITPFAKMANILYQPDDQVAASRDMQNPDPLQNQPESGLQGNEGNTNPDAANTSNTSANAQPGNKQNAPHDVTAGDTLRPEEKAGQPIVSETNDVMARIQKDNADQLPDPNSTDPEDIARGKRWHNYMENTRALILGLLMNHLEVDPNRLYADSLGPLIRSQPNLYGKNDDANTFKVRPEWQDAYQQGLKLTQRVQNIVNKVKQNTTYKFEPGSPRAKSAEQFFTKLRDDLTARLLQFPDTPDKVLYSGTATADMLKWMDKLGGNAPSDLSPKAPELWGDASEKNEKVGEDNYYLVAQTSQQVCGGDKACIAQLQNDPGSQNVTPIKSGGNTLYLQKGYGDNDAYLKRLEYEKDKQVNNEIGYARTVSALTGDEPGAGVLEAAKLAMDGKMLLDSDHPWQDAASMASAELLSKGAEKLTTMFGLGENYPKAENTIKTLAGATVDNTAGSGMNKIFHDAPGSSHHNLISSERARQNKQHTDAMMFRARAMSRMNKNGQ